MVAVVAVLAGTLGYGAHGALSSPRLADPADTREALAPPPSAEPPGPVTSQTTPRTRSASPPVATSSSGSPSRVELPSLGESLSVVPVGVDDEDALQLPEDPDTAGWYRFGAGPGSAKGASVISAHADNASEVGPLARLDDLERGDTIRVTVGDEHLVYSVSRVDHHAKQALDLDALFARTGPPRLHLVSCGGEFDPDTKSYEDNVVAVATPVAGPAYSDPRDE